MKRRHRAAVSPVEVLPPLAGGRTPSSPVSEAQRATLWQPGQSGNPTGQSKTEVQIRRLIRGKGEAITNKMMQTFFDTSDERVITVLGKELLYRAYGKPKDAHPNDDMDRARPDVSKLSETQRATLKKLLLKAVGREEVEE
jgi:hypothetical protein